MKMKFTLVPVAASLALFMGSASADPIAPVDLRVVGTLDVPACTVTAADNGIYDFGDLSPTDIKPGTGTTTLPEITKNWTIDCDGDTYLTFKVNDNAEGTANGTLDTQFGLGNVNGAGKVGFYTVQLLNAKVDQVTSHVFATNTTTLSNKALTTTVRKNNYSMGWASSTASVQQIGSLFEADMKVIATLAGTQIMNGPITDDVPLDGSLTLDFAYGL